MKGGGVIVLHISRIGLTPLPPSAKSPTMKWTTMKCTHYEITDPAWRLDPPPSLRTMKSIHCKSPLWEFLQREIHWKYPLWEICKGGYTVNDPSICLQMEIHCQSLCGLFANGKTLQIPFVELLQRGIHCKFPLWGFCKGEYTAKPNCYFCKWEYTANTLCEKFAKGNTLQTPLVFSQREIT